MVSSRLERFFFFSFPGTMDRQGRSIIGVLVADPEADLATR